MGCYPLFSCKDWTHLHADLEKLAGELVCLYLVTDPFGEFDITYLRRCFPDVARPFKDHFVVDLDHSPETFVSSHHRRNARKAFRSVDVESCLDPAEFLNDWVSLYSALVQRREIKGIPAFSKSSFAQQLRVPGTVSFRAIRKGITVGMIIWYVQGQVGYYHLGAYSGDGYEFGASFALFWRSLEYFSEAGRVQWLNLGAGAGIRSEGNDGLSRFKRGWATGTRIAYFCGRIFDQAKYAEIVRGRQVPTTDYFPLYRLGEFG
jgi:hypothetical protein